MDYTGEAGESAEKSAIPEFSKNESNIVIATTIYWISLMFQAPCEVHYHIIPNAFKWQLLP